MKKNVGRPDKLIRMLIAAVIGILYYQNIITGTTGIVLMVVAIILALTSLINFCPLYAVLGVNTCKVK